MKRIVTIFLTFCLLFHLKNWICLYCLPAEFVMSCRALFKEQVCKGGRVCTLEMVWESYLANIILITGYFSWYIGFFESIILTFMQKRSIDELKCNNALVLSSFHPSFSSPASAWLLVFGNVKENRAFLRPAAVLSHCCEAFRLFVSKVVEKKL